MRESEENIKGVWVCTAAKHKICLFPQVQEKIAEESGMLFPVSSANIHNKFFRSKPN
jgi:hypothetical protein